MKKSSAKIAVLVKRFPKLSETFILGEITSLIEAGIDVCIISLFRPTEDLQQPGVNRFSDKVIYLDNRIGIKQLYIIIRLMLKRVGQMPSLFRQLRRSTATLRQLCNLYAACDRHNIVHIHAHYISEPALLADLTSRVNGRTFSVSAHAKDIYLTDEATIRARLRNAAFVTTCTAHNQSFLLRHADSDSAQVHLLYHGVDSQRFKPTKAAANELSPLLVGVGRYKRKKGFDLLIAACAKLVSDNVPLRCEIIGYGDQESHLRSLISKNGLTEHVSLRAPVNHNELVSILQDATVCVLPCRQTEDGDRDGIPNVMLEAMSCEIPVVSTNVSGIPEVIRSGENGLLVAPEDVHELAGAIRSILLNSPLRRRLGKSGRRTVTNMFCWQNNIGVLSELLLSTTTASNGCQSA